MEEANEDRALRPPANPNRARLPERRRRGSNRVRVTRACDRCKKRKIRCTGIQPCELCVSTDSRCTFDASYSRGRRPRLHTRTNDSFRTGVGVNVQDIPGSPFDSETADTPAQSPSGGNRVPVSVANADPQSLASPEPTTRADLQGDYVGPASGVSFLRRFQKRLQQYRPSSHASSIFTFGDAPLRSLNPPYCVVMSNGETTRLLQRYFDFTVPVDRFLHRPTMERCLQEFHDNMGVVASKSSAPAQTALLFMVFAIAEQHVSAHPTAASVDISIRYFLAADSMLAKERGAVSLASVQARLCQCLWLLSRSRINHCWSLFGTTARLALSIGLHRKVYRNHADGSDYINMECRRRTFWSAYSLDNYLSTALGRPRIFHDDDIDQELPSTCNDDDIHADHITSGTSHGQSLMMAPVAYYRLGRILSMVLRDLYSVRPSSTADQCDLALKYSQALGNWRAELSDFLDASNTGWLIPIFQRQRNVLNLAYWHTAILIHRPLFLTKFLDSQHNGEGRDLGVHNAGINRSVQECLQAAIHITDTVNDMNQAGQVFQAYWLTTYVAFSAVVVLYVYAIHQSPLSLTADTYGTHLTAATRCHNQIFKVAEKGSLAARYCMVLADLRAEAMRETERRPQSEPLVGPNNRNGNGTISRPEVWIAPSDRPISADTLTFPEASTGGNFVDFFHPEGSSDSREDAMGGINSMLTSGFGNIDSLVNNDLLFL